MPLVDMRDLVSLDFLETSILAEHCRSPVILSLAESHFEGYDFALIMAAVERTARRAMVAVAIHFALRRIQRPLNASTEDFVARLNAAERDDDGDYVDPKDQHWILGDRQRNRGSLYLDVWEALWLNWPIAASLPCTGQGLVAYAPGSATLRAPSPQPHRVGPHQAVRRRSLHHNRIADCRHRGHANLSEPKP